MKLIVFIAGFILGFLLGVFTKARKLKSEKDLFEYRSWKDMKKDEDE